MIDYLEGKVIDQAENSLIISVNGVGFRVFVTKSVLERVEIHKTAALYTHLVVREESLTLYGFENEDVKEMFVLLLSVSGVGPRTAMAMVSSLDKDMIENAILTNQPEKLSSIQGVGKKTAESIVLHLRGKVKGTAAAIQRHGSALDTDVLAALTNLGYSIIEAQAAIQAIPENTPENLEIRIRIALSYFS